MRALQVLEAAFNDDANMADYATKFKPNHPVGKVTREFMANYAQITPTMRVSVPVVLFIDRKGTVQFQTHGGEQFFQPETELKNHFRDAVQKLLAADAPAPTAKGSKKK